MDNMAVAKINGKMISWALRRSGGTLESLATAKITPEKLAAWERGDDFPSEGDAESLASRLSIAYPMLFMKNVPPDEPIKTPDLRTFEGGPLRKPSMALLDVLDSTRARQNWIRNELKEEGVRPLSFVAKFADADVEPSVIARDMRDIFGINDSTRKNAGGYEEFLKLLVAKSEEIGVLVMRSAVVGHASRRSLDVKEFRGFVLLDSFAPIVFINDKDAKAAQIFTFAHELAHIWIGAAGISDRTPDEKGSSTNPIEIKCDAIAADFLVPKNNLTSFWNPASSLDVNMLNAARHFKVSSLVILRRAKDLGLISRSTFFTKVGEQYELYKRREREQRDKPNKDGGKKKAGGNFWNSFEIRNGHKFNTTVVKAVREQRTTFAEAGSLFGITPDAAAKYLQKIGAE